MARQLTPLWAEMAVTVLCLAFVSTYAFISQQFTLLTHIILSIYIVY